MATCADVDASLPTIDLDAARAALRRAADDFSALIASAPDPDQRIPDSEWTVRDVAVHVALGSEAYVRYATGGTEAWVDISDIAGGSLARSSAERLAAEPARDLPALAERAKAAVGALIEATEGRSDDEPVVWNGMSTKLGAMLGLGLAEYLLHGRDVAKALGRPWSITPDDARLILASALPMLPLLLDPAATAGVRARYELRVRGGTRIGLSIRDGQLSMDSGEGRVDCHVSADPVALLLVSYGRQSQWVPALTGKLLAWGRKPWLGLRLTHYLVAP
jgi:uncharacterized protein (TIGR03083 family)